MRPARLAGRHLRRRAPLAVLLVLAVAAGSGGNTAGEAARDPLVGEAYYASPTAVCTLLDADDLAMALGAAYQRGRPPGGVTYAFAGLPGVTKCYYPPASEGVGSVEVGVVYAYPEQVFAERRDRLGDRAVAVDGVGAAAVWDRDGHELLVRADGRLVGISVPATVAWRERELIERARRLAETAIGRLR